MGDANNSSGGHGIGFTGLLTIVFITLKLTHVINWSWWWVLSPIWIGLVLFLIFLAALAVGYAIYSAMGGGNG